MVKQMYAYDDNDNIRRKWSLMEGTTLHQPLNRSLADQAKRNSNAMVDNPYFENNPGTTSPGFTDDSFQFVKICLPLTGSGIFRNPKIFSFWVNACSTLSFSFDDFACWLWWHVYE
eukprot:COSAG02_NODE_10912_length_1833_cov_3.805652_2_plen_116_part_00